MARRLEVQILGDASSLLRSFSSGEAGSKRFASTLEGAHNRVSHSFGSMAKRALGAGTAIVGAYASITGAKDAISTTEDLAKTTLSLHNNLGLSVHSASQWGAVARSRNIDTKALNQSFGTLSKNAVAATQGYKLQRIQLGALGTTQKDVGKRLAILSKGGGSVAVAFQKLGISQKDLTKSGKNFNALLGQAADGLGKMGPGTDRTTLAMKLFGKGWQTIVPVLRDGSKAMNDQLALADKYGVTFQGKTVKSVSDLISAQREAKFASMGLQVTLGTVLIPTLTKVVKAGAEFVAGIRNSTGAGGKFRDVVVKVFGDIKTTVGNVVHAVTGLLAKHRADIQSTIQVVGLIGNAFSKTLPIVKQNIDAMLAKLRNMASVIGGVVSVIKGVLTLDFGQVWDGVKRIFSGGIQGTIQIIKNATAPIRAVAGAIGKAVSTVIGGAWNALKGIVSSVVGFMKARLADVLGFFQSILEAASHIPLIGGKFKDAAQGVQAMRDSLNGVSTSASNAIGLVGTLLNQLAAANAKKLPGDPSRAVKSVGSGGGGGKVGNVPGWMHVTGGRGGARGLQSLTFPIEGSIASLTARKDALQTRWDAIDARAQRHGLTGDLKAAQGMQVGKGHATTGERAQAIKQATSALRDFDVAAKRARQSAKIDLGIGNLTKLTALKASVDNIKGGLKDLGVQAAATFRQMREGQINAAHDATVKAIGNSADAQELARLQAQDAAEQDAATTAQLQQDLNDAVSSGDIKAQQTAQTAIEDYTRSKREDALTANLAAAQQAADDTQQTSLDGLDKEEDDYQSSLDTRLLALTANLGKSKQSYATFVDAVEKILKPLGLTFDGSADDEAAINALTGKGKAKGKGKRGRAAGGYVMPGRTYRVGEVGPEDFTASPTGAGGTITPASRSHAGASVVMYGVTIGSQRAAERLANQLAFRARYG